jgi:signal transduction histidine kinase
VEVAVEVDPDLVVSTEIEQLVFRAAQEAIRNVAAHAEATHVTVGVSCEHGSVTLRVVDDGRGFDADEPPGRPEGHFGLLMLSDLARSAGGELRVTSRIGAGTTVELGVPAR